MVVIVIMIYPVLHILHKVNKKFKKNFYILVKCKSLFIKHYIFYDS